jgi:hypothetical protein
MKDITVITYGDVNSTRTVTSLSEATDSTEGYMLDDFKSKSDNYQALLSTASRACSKENILSVGKWPETKTVWKTECTSPPIRICTDVPYVYTRECQKFLYGEVCYPTDLRKDAEECLKIAVAAALLAIPSGGAAGAKAAFIASITSCIASKFGQRAKEISFGTDVGSSCGKWGR